MKATTWLCPALTLLCAINLVSTAQRGSYGGYPLDSLDLQMLQNENSLFKRNKPSLSIVNPLDVLRQRLLLEIARRQMKENSRQVELNRAILKNVGKRATSKYSFPLTAHLYELRELQEQQQQQQQQQHDEPIESLQLDEYDLLPTTLIFDYLQKQQQQQQQQRLRPWLSYDSNAIPFVNNYINEDIVAAAGSSSPSAMDVRDAEFVVEENTEPELIAFNGLVDSSSNLNKHIKQSNNEHSSTKPNEQQRQQQLQHEAATTFQKSLINNHQLYRNKNDLNINLNDENPVSLKPTAIDYKHEQRNDNDGDYQLQHYLYRLHKNRNHLTRN